MSSLSISAIRFDILAIVLGMIFMAIAAVRVHLNCKNLTITFFTIGAALIASVVAIVIVIVASVAVSFFTGVAASFVFKEVIEVVRAGEKILFFLCAAVYEVAMLFGLYFLNL